jgi:hypothetical protein
MPCGFGGRHGCRSGKMKNRRRRGNRGFELDRSVVVVFEGECVGRLRCVSMSGPGLHSAKSQK